MRNARLSRIAMLLAILLAYPMSPTVFADADDFVRVLPGSPFGAHRAKDLVTRQDNNAFAHTIESPSGQFINGTDITIVRRARLQQGRASLNLTGTNSGFIGAIMPTNTFSGTTRVVSTTSGQVTITQRAASSANPTDIVIAPQIVSVGIPISSAGFFATGVDNGASGTGFGFGGTAFSAEVGRMGVASPLNFVTATSLASLSARQRGQLAVTVGAPSFVPFKVVSSSSTSAVDTTLSSDASTNRLNRALSRVTAFSLGSQGTTVARTATRGSLGVATVGRGFALTSNQTLSANRTLSMNRTGFSSVRSSISNGGSHSFGSRSSMGGGFHSVSIGRSSVRSR